MTKQEVIQQAYGEYWEQVKVFVDENGYCNKKDFTMRPKSLQGIENNNGWIKIESFNDLPKTNIEQQNYIANENGIFDFLASNAQIEMKFKNNTCTHYQPIEKPKPPIY